MTASQLPAWTQGNFQRMLDLAYAAGDIAMTSATGIRMVQPAARAHLLKGTAIVDNIARECIGNVPHSSITWCSDDDVRPCKQYNAALHHHQLAGHCAWRYDIHEGFLAGKTACFNEQSMMASLFQ